MSQNIRVVVLFGGRCPKTAPDRRRQRAWVDNVFAAAGTTDPSPAAGLLSAHFHLSLDGVRVLADVESSLHRRSSGEGRRLRPMVFPGNFRIMVAGVERALTPCPE